MYISWQLTDTILSITRGKESLPKTASSFLVEALSNCTEMTQLTWFCRKLNLFYHFWWNVAIYTLCQIFVKCRDLRSLTGTKFWLPGAFNYSAPLPIGYTWVHFGTSGSTWVYLGELGSTWVNPDRLGSTWVILGLLWSTWVNLGLLGSTWVFFGQLASTWIYFGLLGSTWVNLGLLWSTWVYFGQL